MLVARGSIGRRFFHETHSPQHSVGSTADAPCFSGAVSATDTARIVGSVADNSGTMIPGATLTATNQATNQTSTTTTDSAGAYNPSALKPGRYHIEAKETNRKPPRAICILVSISAMEVFIAAPHSERQIERWRNRG